MVGKAAKLGQCLVTLTVIELTCSIGSFSLKSRDDIDGICQGTYGRSSNYAVSLPV